VATSHFFPGKNTRRHAQPFLTEQAKNHNQHQRGSYTALNIAENAVLGKFTGETLKKSKK